MKSYVISTEDQIFVVRAYSEAKDLCPFPALKVICLDDIYVEVNV